MRLSVIIHFLLVSFLAEALAEDNCSDEIRALRQDHQNLRDIVESLVARIQSQDDIIQKMEEQNRELVTSNRDLQHKYFQLSGSLAIQSLSMSCGCIDDVIYLACPFGYSIDVTYAYYGQSPLNCPDDCCFPDASDCKELVSNNSMLDWTRLTNACNGQGNCSHEYEGAVINECREDYIADYMKIVYGCLLYDNQTLPVGFTAYATTDRQYELYYLVLFDAVTTNIGNHYNANTSIFTCPYNGVYMFSINFLADMGYVMGADIVVGDYHVADAFNDYSASSSSAIAVTECTTGQKVWVQCTLDDSSMYGGKVYKLSHFSGALIQAYV